MNALTASLNGGIVKVTLDGVTTITLNGLLHCDTGPAVFNEDHSLEEYWIEGKLHRLDGPAQILPNGESRFFVGGHFFTSPSFQLLCEMIEAGITPLPKTALDSRFQEFKRLRSQLTL